MRVRPLPAQPSLRSTPLGAAARTVAPTALSALACAELVQGAEHVLLGAMPAVGGTSLPAWAEGRLGGWAILGTATSAAAMAYLAEDTELGKGHWWGRLLEGTRSEGQALRAELAAGRNDLATARLGRLGGRTAGALEGGRLGLRLGLGLAGPALTAVNRLLESTGAPLPTLLAAALPTAITTGCALTGQMVGTSLGAGVGGVAGYAAGYLLGSATPGGTSYIGQK